MGGRQRARTRRMRADCQVSCFAHPTAAPGLVAAADQPPVRQHRHRVHRAVEPAQFKDQGRACAPRGPLEHRARVVGGKLPGPTVGDEEDLHTVCTRSASLLHTGELRSGRRGPSRVGAPPHVRDRTGPPVKLRSGAPHPVNTRRPSAGTDMKPGGTWGDHQARSRLPRRSRRSGGRWRTGVSASERRRPEIGQVCWGPYRRQDR